MDVLLEDVIAYEMMAARTADVRRAFGSSWLDDCVRNG